MKERTKEEIANFIEDRLDRDDILPVPSLVKILTEHLTNGATDFELHVNEEGGYHVISQ